MVLSKDTTSRSVSQFSMALSEASPVWNIVQEAWILLFRWMYYCNMMDFILPGTYGLVLHPPAGSHKC